MENPIVEPTTRVPRRESRAQSGFQAAGGRQGWEGRCLGCLGPWGNVICYRSMDRELMRPLQARGLGRLISSIAKA